MTAEPTASAGNDSTVTDIGRFEILTIAEDNPVTLITEPAANAGKDVT